MKPLKLSREQVAEMRNDVRYMSMGQLAEKYGVTHETVLKYLHREYEEVRTQLISKGKSEREAASEAYEEVYKCQPVIRTIEV